MSEIGEEGNCARSPTICGSEGVDHNVGEEELVARRERRRKNIVDELFETEKTYLHHLEVTHKVGIRDHEYFNLVVNSREYK